MANITVDITTLSNYSSISLGSHQLTVVAKAPGFLDSNPSTAVTFVNGYELVFDTISNCTYTPSPSMISAFDSTTITFTPDAHYVLPDSIYVGGTADHTWDKSTGRLVLSNVKSNITLECEATLETFPVTISATGCTYSPTGWTEVAYGEGGEIWLQNVESGYRLPDSVTVTGASYEYNKDSGFIRISNATGAVTVTITCVQIYTITATITNGSWSGDTQVDVGASAMGVIMPNSGYSYPMTVSATNATVNYSSIDGSLILADITGNVVITAECLVQLSTPQNVSADGTTVSWDEVENATSYEVLADGVSIGTVENVTEDALAGTWVFNDTPTLQNTKWTVSFISNNHTFTSLSVSTRIKCISYLGYFPADESIIYDNSGVVSTPWVKGEAYKTITITSKLSEVTNGDALLNWLQANATKQ